MATVKMEIDPPTAAETSSIRNNFSTPDSLFDRCQRVYGWEASFTRCALVGYGQFMRLKVALGDCEVPLISPPPIIEKVWVQHILDVNGYATACRDFCGRSIHHNPDEGHDHGNNGEASENLEGRRNSTKIAIEGSLEFDSIMWAFNTKEPATSSSSSSSNIAMDSQDQVDGDDKAASRKRQRTEADSDNINDNKTKINKPGTVPLTIFARETNTHQDLYFKILPTTKMSKLFHRFALHVGRETETFTFLFRDKLVKPTDNAHNIGMKDGDMLYAAQCAAVEIED